MLKTFPKIIVKYILNIKNTEENGCFDVWISWRVKRNPKDKEWKILMLYNFFFINIIKNLYILKLFKFYMIKKTKCNEFEKTYKNNLLILIFFSL